MIHANDVTMTIAKEVEHISKSVTLLGKRLESLESEVSNSVKSLDEQLQRVANDVAIMESEKMAQVVTPVPMIPTVTSKLNPFEESPDNVNHILEGWNALRPQIDLKTKALQDESFTDLKSERQMAEETATTTASNSTDVLIGYVDDQIETLKQSMVERFDRIETDLAYVESETTGLTIANKPQTTTVISDKTISKADALIDIVSKIDSANVDINVNGSILVRKRNNNGVVVFNLSI
jgi:hypothetical protein